MKKKKDHILKTTVRLFANSGSVVATDKIAQKADVSKGTLFNYFPTKQNLIDSTFLYLKKKLVEELLKTYNEDDETREGINKTFKSFVLWAMKNPKEYKVLIYLRFSNKLSKEALTEADEIFEVFNCGLEDAIKNQEIIDVPVDYLCMVFGGNMEALISYINENGLKEQEIDKFIDITTSIIWNGIKKQ